MFGYYLLLALRSLQRTPALTGLMILAVGFGVGASMTMYAVVRGLSADPIPQKSSRLFVPQVDPWGPGFRAPNNEPPDRLDYATAAALMRQHRAGRQSAIYSIASSVMPASGALNRSPIRAEGYAVYSGFFPMADVPFAHGEGWTVEDDALRSPVAVISDSLNRQVFGGGNSVGRVIDIGNRDYRVVGVMQEWNPQPNFFADFDFRERGPDVFLPFTHAIATRMANDSGVSCRKGGTDPGDSFVDLVRSNCAWVSYLVELPDAAAVHRYRDYLDAYASDQQRLGRFRWAPNNRLRDVPAFLRYKRVVPGDTRVSMLVAQGLLVVCLLNTVGLLLARFLRRGGEIAVRRALGASRNAIHAQFLTEAAVVGLAGGVLGLAFTVMGVLAVGQVMPERLAALARVDPTLLVLTLLLAVGVTLMAAVYPAYRASRVPPAWQLKAQ